MKRKFVVSMVREALLQLFNRGSISVYFKALIFWVKYKVAENLNYCAGWHSYIILF